MKRIPLVIVYLLAIIGFSELCLIRLGFATPLFYRKYHIFIGVFSLIASAVIFTVYYRKWFIK